MKNFSKKSILQKTIIAIIITLLLSNFIVPTYSQAYFGGVLINPIIDLVCSLGDAVINLLQAAMTGSAGSSGSMNWSLSAFLMESSQYYGSDKHVEASGGTKVKVDSKKFDKGWLGLKDEYYVPVATYSPEQIFAGKVPGLDINFINPNFDGEYEKATIFDKYKDDKGYKLDGPNGNRIPLSSAGKLQPTIATWYVALRNLTIVGLLSVLVYVGIRIIISSTASDKAKYKQMLMDWLIALCIVFFLHYIMSFTLTLTQSITEAIAGEGNATVSVEDTGASGGTKSFGTNLLGLARFQTQYEDFGQKIAYLIMYLALVIYTVIFTWFYLKRLLMMAFLTLIAPVVALTYPIDKISDGKSQAFDSWLKEYIFNALIQPFHLIIYTVFVGSAMDLASSNIIYMIAALGFILPAEKILRKFFGFEKAGSTLGALAGAAALGSVAKKFIGGSGGKGKGKSSEGGKLPDGEKPPRFENKHDISDIEDNQGSRPNINTTGNEGLEEEEQKQTPQNIHDRAAEMLAEEEKKMTVQDYRESGMKPQEWRENRQKEIEEQLNKEQQAKQAPNSTANNSTGNNASANSTNNSTGNNASAFTNWRNAHNINKRSAAGLAVKGIKGAAKFATKTAFKAGTGSLAAAVALASGSGLAGAGAAFAAGSAVGGKLGDAAVKAGGKLYDGASRVGKGIAASYNAELGDGKAAFANELFAGTKIGRELDLAHGNTHYQDIADKKAFKTDKNNLDYLRKQHIAKHGGQAPSPQDLEKEMNSYDAYLNEGMRDIKEIQRAKKAEEYGISDKQSALIAQVGKEKGITADVLNDEKQYKAKRNNMIHEHMAKGKDKAEATRLTDHTMNVLKVQNGVAHNMQKPPKTKK